MKKRLFWLLFPSYWIPTSGAIVAVALYVLYSMSNLYSQTLEKDLHTRAVLLADQVAPLLQNPNNSSIDSLCKRLGKTTGTRFTVLLPAGTVAGDSTEDRGLMEKTKEQPEIQKALDGDTGIDRRYSHTMKKEMIYIAVPLKDEDKKIRGVVRAALPTALINGNPYPMSIQIIVGSILTGILALGACFVVTRRITTPLREMGQITNLFAVGNLTHQIPCQQITELGELAESLNAMSDQLNHLETVRSDFVANVSHELKTPITSIKGFVETLLSDDWNHEPDVLRFLKIINQQSGRMTTIIDDLLTLSRLEQKEGVVIKEYWGLASVLDNAKTLCQLQAEEKNITITTDCSEDLTATINAPLIEQALVNLIINAIKYSESDQIVHIVAERQDGQVVIQVKDTGFGIEEKHLHRLFERFYRGDTARSRKLGGTGLGLSIVNHIVQAHDGVIRVKSKPREGSLFTIILTDA